jgi:hypothetical protein
MTAQPVVARPVAQIAIRRSELTVPGHLPDLLRKAAAS